MEIVPPMPATPNPIDNVVVVLNETQDLVNIAGSLRAMMNMGLHRLRLVRPATFDAYRIEGIAHGSGPLIERIEFFDSLREAVADTIHVAALTARRRSEAFVWQRPREAAPELLSLAGLGEGPVALVFGREDKGLSNDELDLCDRALTIPADPRHSSLNLAQAVLLICYELRMAGPLELGPLPSPRRAGERLANVEEMQQVFEETERALDAVDFFKTRKSAAIMRTLRAIARRASLDTREAKLLRAIAFEVQKVLRRGGASPA